jgi:hypothetical protein
VGIYYLPVICQQGKVSHIYAIDAIQVGNAIKEETVWSQPLPGKSLNVLEINYTIRIQIAYELGLSISGPQGLPRRTGQKCYQYQ